MGCKATREAYLKRRVEGGWKLEADGNLHKGTDVIRFRGREFMAPMPWPGQSEFNPRKHAWALFMGGELVPELSTRRSIYRLPSGLLCTRDGDLLAEGECPECGSVNREYGLRVAVRSPERFAKGPAWTWCRRCYTVEEIEELRQRAEAAMQATPRRR